MQPPSPRKRTQGMSPFSLHKGGHLKQIPTDSSYQFFSVRIVCDSCGRAMDITWLRSLLTKDWKLGWPRYPGSRENSGLEPGPGKSGQAPQS